MPLQKNVPLVYQVETVAIDGSGACSVLLSTSAGGQRLQSQQVQLDAQTCAPVWQAVGVPGVSRWTDLKTQLYGLLQAQGVIPT